MGLLAYADIKTYDYKESKKYQRKLKEHAANQFLRLLAKYANYTEEARFYRKYGYELEMHAIQSELKAGKTNWKLQTDLSFVKEANDISFQVLPEYGRWMVEMVPYSPMDSFLYAGGILSSMETTYNQTKQICKDGKNRVLSLPFFPKLGSPSFVEDLGLAGKTIDEIKEINKETSCSGYMLDNIINSHPRFPTFTRNVRMRRTENPPIEFPLFKDELTDMENVLEGERTPGHSYLDAFTFGMGLGCLQVTLGSKNMEEARWLYDQMHQFGPLFVHLFYLFSNRF